MGGEPVIAWIMNFLRRRAAEAEDEFERERAENRERLRSLLSEKLRT